jgi:O-acetyl-ADP-ribose deacetylase (regulator of RNase III)
MTRIIVTEGDITSFDIDVIVNAANPALAGGGGVDGAIHHAGGPTILEECRRWVAANGQLRTGEAMVTDAGDLSARYVVHTVGPVWGDHDDDTARQLLASCYRNSLELAAGLGCASIAFPNISTGIYGFPKELAAETAVESVRSAVAQGSNPSEVVFVCFNSENRAIYSRLLGF